MKYIYILLIALVFSSCATKIYDYQLQCNKDKQQIMSEFIRLVTSQGMQVKAQDINLGFAQAESLEERNIWTGYLMQNFWTINIKDNIITMSAYNTVKTTNEFGATLYTTVTYYKEDTHNDHGWFWNVRDGIQDLCGGEYQIILRKENERKRKTN